MLEREEKGEIQWQRAVVNTMSILRKAGISQNEASKTAALIQVIEISWITQVCKVLLLKKAMGRFQSNF